MQSELRMERFKVICICWHSVESDSINPEFLDGTNPTVSLFREQMRFLIEHYSPISIRQFMELSENPSLLSLYKKPPILLTFDDGFKNVIDQALPVLSEFGVPASFFVIGQIIKDPDFVPWYVEGTHMLRRTPKTTVVYQGTTLNPRSQEGRAKLMHLFYCSFGASHTYAECETKLFDLSELLAVKRPRACDLDSDLRLVNADDLTKLGASSLLSIGSHAMTHRFLNNLSYTEQIFELEQSQLLLSKISPLYFPALAYPGGAFNGDTVAIAQGRYKCAFALAAGSSYRNIYVYPRVIIGRNTASHLAYAISPLRLSYLLPFKRLLRTSRIWNSA